ncbi:MAG TPA: hypothetical protein VI895_04140, partial [Bdellovibrionota bacterium]|nr:hypothetical protein [Bdellovibrionota bacterium]
LSTPHAGWPTWPGMGGRHPPECPADILRNHWPAWPGITGRFAPEYAVDRAVPLDDLRRFGIAQLRLDEFPPGVGVAINVLNLRVLCAFPVAGKSVTHEIFGLAGF